MKRYKNLWEQFISMENLELAARKAVKSKKNKRVVRNFLENKDALLKKLQSDLINGKFKTSEYKTFTIYEPKQRVIYKLPLYPDHIVHHALINIIGPIWQSTFIQDSYACIPGRGLHAASKRVMHFIRKYKYVLQCDIRKFFPSINHEVMFNIVKKKIGDKKLLAVLRNIIFSCGNETNLPIGNLTSQWMGNVYLNEMDHFIKEKLRVHAYIRYCDDFLIFGDNKLSLHEMEKKIQIFVIKNLKMVFSKSFVYPVFRGIPFIGYRHFCGFVLLRRFGARKMLRRIFNIVKFHDRSENSIGQLAAFYGWAKWCCSYNFKLTIFFMTIKTRPSMARFIKRKFFITF